MPNMVITYRHKKRLWLCRFDLLRVNSSGEKIDMVVYIRSSFLSTRKSRNQFIILWKLQSFIVDLSILNLSFSPHPLPIEWYGKALCTCPLLDLIKKSMFFPLYWHFCSTNYLLSNCFHCTNWRASETLSGLFNRESRL